MDSVGNADVGLLAIPNGDIIHVKQVSTGGDVSGISDLIQLESVSASENVTVGGPGVHSGPTPQSEDFNPNDTSSQVVPSKGKLSRHSSVERKDRTKSQQSVRKKDKKKEKQVNLPKIPDGASTSRSKTFASTGLSNGKTSKKTDTKKKQVVPKGLSRSFTEFYPPTKKSYSNSKLNRSIGERPIGPEHAYHLVNESNLAAMGKLYQSTSASNWSLYSDGWQSADTDDERGKDFALDVRGAIKYKTMHSIYGEDTKKQRRKKQEKILERLENVQLEEWKKHHKEYRDYLRKHKVTKERQKEQLQKYRDKFEEDLVKRFRVSRHA